jgi:hypothetical protein
LRQAGDGLPWAVFGGKKGTMSIFLIALAASCFGLGALCVLFVWCAWRQGWKDDGEEMRNGKGDDVK